MHMTIASIEHEPQSWQSVKVWKENKILRIVTDLYDMAQQLPGYVGFYNGVGAGASIEEHFHFQFFKIPSGHGFFPLQQVASIVGSQTRATAMLVDENIYTLVIDDIHYPLTTFRFSGERERLITAAVDRIEKWSKISGDSASANISVMWENNSLVMYLIPRNRFYSRAIGMAGFVGGLEVLGEFIFCTDEENKLINTQMVNYNYMASILLGVKPPNVDRINLR
jgi:hypothetical protein